MGNAPKDLTVAKRKLPIAVSLKKEVDDLLGVGFGTWLVFALGILLGLLLGSKDIRVKFFKGLRGFLGQVNKGAKEEEKRQNKNLRGMHDGIQGYGKNVVGRKHKTNEDDDDEDEYRADY